jgi:hypothetical protein
LSSWLSDGVHSAAAFSGAASVAAVLLQAFTRSAYSQKTGQNDGDGDRLSPLQMPLFCAINLSLKGKPMRRVLAALAIAFLGAQPALAAPIFFTTNLSGPNEAPPNASPGTGTAFVTIDPVAHTLQVDVTFSGLVATTTASHIHVINGPGDLDLSDTIGPVATTTPSFVGFPLGVTSGSMNQTYDTLASSSYRAGFINAAGGVAQAEAALFDGIISGRAYLNIHTTVFTGGEIRGFLTPVAPEPSLLVLLTAGGAGLFARRRARRRTV